MAEALEVYRVEPDDGFAAPWLLDSSGKGVFVEKGRLPEGARAEWRPWRMTPSRRMTPVPDVSNSSSALLIRPELLSGLPMTRGVDYLEVDVLRTDFPHRILDFLPLEGAFARDLSEYTTVPGLDFELIITVQKYFFDQARIGNRRAFVTPEFGWRMFATRPIVDYVASVGARGLTFEKLWSSVD
jgi:hypothetical protein